MKSVIQVKAMVVLLIVLIFVAFAPASNPVSPPPDGGYPNFNTETGASALETNTTAHSRSTPELEKVI
jgi:hypothetical protein